jgi:hypothetical protein
MKRQLKTQKQRADELALIRPHAQTIKLLTQLDYLAASAGADEVASAAGAAGAASAAGAVSAGAASGAGAAAGASAGTTTSSFLAQADRARAATRALSTSFVFMCDLPNVLLTISSEGDQKPEPSIARSEF